MIAVRPCRVVVWWIVLVGLWGLSGVAQPAVPNVFDFGGGVRALGMGEAFVGLADDEQAVFYNPAGLGYLKGISLSANYERHFGASDYASLLGALPHLGAHLLFFSFGSVEERTADDELTGSFGYLNIALAASGGIAVDEIPLVFTRGLSSLAVGSRLKLLGISTVAGAGGLGLGLDWSLLFREERPEFFDLFRPEEVRAGLTIENLIGLGIGPFKLKSGLSVRPIPPLTLALDLAIPFEFHFGGEISLPTPPPIPAVALRLGGFAQGGIFSFTLGLGLKVESFRIDYAFISHPMLPGSHQLALSWRF